MALTAQLALEKAKYFSKYFLFRLVVKMRLKIKAFVEEWQVSLACLKAKLGRVPSSGLS